MSKEKINDLNNINVVGVGGGIQSSFMNIFGYINHHVMYLNNSKFFAGIIMILLNIGSKFIT